MKKQPIHLDSIDSVCDVLVIGGGPAGSTIAVLLAQKGYRVTLLEKERHPRFHIGESLLPANLPLLDRLGVLQEVQACSLQKRGAEFVSPWHDHPQSFEFADAWDKSMPYAFQVRRSEFDHILIRNAERKGAEVIEGCRVCDLEFLRDGQGAMLRAVHEDGRSQTWQARFVADASGRDTFLGNRLKIKKRNPKHNACAVYGHFRGARRHQGQREGHITIFWFEQGWFWFIPLADGATSVGMVVWPRILKARQGSLADFFRNGIDRCPALAERLKEARLVSEVQATGNYSYACDHAQGPNYLLLGDAYTFIDPVFSSGVLLAMNSAFAGAEAIDTCLTHPEKTADALTDFERTMKHGPKTFSWFIYRVTNPMFRDMFMAPRHIFHVKEGVVSLLAGDIFGKSPIRGPVRVFKAFYYLTSLLKPYRSIKAWRQRKRNVRVE